MPSGIEIQYVNWQVVFRQNSQPHKGYSSAPQTTQVWSRKLAGVNTTGKAFQDTGPGTKGRTKKPGRAQEQTRAQGQDRTQKGGQVGH